LANSSSRLGAAASENGEVEITEFISIIYDIELCRYMSRPPGGELRNAEAIAQPPQNPQGQTTSDDRSALMTVGQLAERTGLSHKAIRELEGRGLIYSAGRSEANYRLFDQGALWCVGAINQLRSLGLTLAEIEQLHASYLKQPDLSTGPSSPSCSTARSRGSAPASMRCSSPPSTDRAVPCTNPQLLAGATDYEPARADPRRA